MSYFQIRGFARGLSTLKVPARGACSVCCAYDAAYSAKGVRDDLKAFELAMAQVPAPGPAAVVALSGGKDSLSALYLARAVRGWRVAAYLFDNGFIPAPVIAQAQRVCDALGVTLEVDTLEGARRRAFARSVATVTATGATPCDACALDVNRGLERLCARLGTPQVIFGTNFYGSWLDRPSPLAFTGGLTFLNLPYALGITAAQARANVKALGAVIHEFKGVSSNCRVPELVQRRIGRTLGHVPELEVLSLEVMVGHLPRAEALRTLEAKG
jgi:PP-loop superfamily ATP-utilizing enzyme